MVWGGAQVPGKDLGGVFLGQIIGAFAVALYADTDRRRIHIDIAEQGRGQFSDSQSRGE